MAINMVSSASVVGTTTTLSIACSGTSRLLVACLGYANPSPTVTYNGIPMTLGAAYVPWARLYYLFRPPVGTYNLVTSNVGDEGQYGGMSAACFDEVSYSAGIITSASGATAGWPGITLSGIQSGDCGISTFQARYGLFTSFAGGASRIAFIPNYHASAYELSSGTSVDFGVNSSSGDETFYAGIAIRYGIEPEPTEIKSLLQPMWFT